jgi:hypothetical protein
MIKRDPTTSSPPLMPDAVPQEANLAPPCLTLLKFGEEVGDRRCAWGPKGRSKDAPWSD